MKDTIKKLLSQKKLFVMIVYGIIWPTKFTLELSMHTDSANLTHNRYSLIE